MTQFARSVDPFIKLSTRRVIKLFIGLRNERVISGAKYVLAIGNARMRVLSWLFVSAVGAATLTHGCTPRQGSLPVGMSSAGEVSLDRKEETPQKLDIWPHFQRIDQLSVLTSAFRSQGHGTGSWHGQLRANEQGAEALASLTPRTGKFPHGTMFVQSHKTNPANKNEPAGETEGAIDVWFVMEKREDGYYSQGGDWFYGVVTPDGVLQHQGKLESCARCHGQAETDYVFMPPETAKTPWEPDAADTK